MECCGPVALEINRQSRNHFALHVWGHIIIMTFAPTLNTRITERETSSYYIHMHTYTQRAAGWGGRPDVSVAGVQGPDMQHARPVEECGLCHSLWVSSVF